MTFKLSTLRTLATGLMAAFCLLIPSTPWAHAEEEELPVLEEVMRAFQERHRAAYGLDYNQVTGRHYSRNTAFGGMPANGSYTGDKARAVNEMLGLAFSAPYRIMGGGSYDMDPFIVGANPNQIPVERGTNGLAFFYLKDAEIEGLAGSALQSKSLAYQPESDFTNASVYGLITPMSYNERLRLLASRLRQFTTVVDLAWSEQEYKGWWNTTNYGSHDWSTQFVPGFNNAAWTTTFPVNSNGNSLGIQGKCSFNPGYSIVEILQTKGKMRSRLESLGSPVSYFAVATGSFTQNVNLSRVPSEFLGGRSGTYAALLGNMVSTPNPLDLVVTPNVNTQFSLSYNTKSNNANQTIRSLPYGTQPLKTGFAHAITRPQFQHLKSQDSSCSDCADCGPGGATTSLNSFHLSVNLGSSLQGREHYRAVSDAEFLAPAIYNRTALSFEGGSGLTLVKEAFGPIPAIQVVRQAFSTTVVVNVVDVGTSNSSGNFAGYEMQIFNRTPAWIEVDPVTHLLGVPAGAVPFRTVKISNPDFANGLTNQLILEETTTSPSGPQTETTTFAHNATTQVWTKFTQNNARSEGLRTKDIGTTRYELREEFWNGTTLPLMPVPVRRTLTVQQRTSSGMNLVRTVDDPTLAELTALWPDAQASATPANISTDYDYYGATNTLFYGVLKTANASATTTAVTQLAAGDTLEFRVGNNGVYGSDSTGLTLSVTLPQAWNLNPLFAASENATPSPVIGPFSLGSSNDGVEFIQFTAGQHSPTGGIGNSAIQGYYRNATYNGPVVAVNRGTTPATVSGQSPLASEQILMRPGLAGEKAVIRFTAPANGFYSFNATFSRLVTSGGGVDVSVVKRIPFGALPLDGKLARVTSSNGSWSRFSYDALGRVVKTVSGFEDAPATEADEAKCRVQETIYPSATSPDITTFITRTAGIETARSYSRETLEGASRGRENRVCTVAGAAWAASSNLVTLTKYASATNEAAGTIAGRAISTNHPDGTLTLITYHWTPTSAAPNEASEMTITTETGAPNAGGTAILDGNRSIVVTNPTGLTTYAVTQDILSGKTLTSKLATAIDDKGRVTEWTFNDGTTETSVYDCCGLASRTDRRGVTTGYTRDVIIGNGVQDSTSTQGIVTISRSEGLTRKIQRQGIGGDTITQSITVSDLAGRTLSATDAVGNVTTYSESIDPATGHRIQTTTRPDGSTAISESYRDATPFKSYGTGVYESYAKSGADAIGNFTISSTTPIPLTGDPSGQWTKTWTDLAGRTLKSTSSGAGTTQYFYNALGQLIKTTDPDGVTTLYAYNARGRQTIACLDVNRNGIIDFTGTDRVVQTITAIGSFTPAGGAAVDAAQTVTSAWATNGVNAATTLREQYSSLDGRKSWSVQDGLTSMSSSTVPVAGAWTQTTTAADGTSQISTYTNGRLVSSANKDNAGTVMHSMSYGYDAHGRLTTVTDSRNGISSTTYDNADRSLTNTTADPDGADPQVAQTTSTTYNNMGQVWTTTTPDNLVTTNTYFLTGELQSTSGPKVYPTSYTYERGKVKTMTTQQSATVFAVTTWNYDPANGRLLSKRYADNKGDNYTYTLAGRPLTHTNARGIITGNFYDGSTTLGAISGAGEVTAVTSTDAATMPITRVMNRLGQTIQLTDAAGTHTYALSATGRLLSESISGGILDGASLTPGYDALFRRTSLTLSGTGVLATSPITQNFTPEVTTSRLATASMGTANANYTYDPNSRLIQNIAFANGSTARLNQSRTYDFLNRLINITNTPTLSAAPVHALNYGYNDLNQRTGVNFTDGTNWTWDYNDRGEIETATQKQGATPLPAQTYDYAYDDIGNRLSETRSGGGAVASARTATPNALNQNTSATTPSTLHVSGQANSTATVTVNSAATTRTGVNWYAPLSVSNTSGPAVATATIEATDGTNTDSFTRTALIAAANAAPTYDEEGNLTQDSLWKYTWDGQNRLIQLESASGVPAAPPRVKLKFTYDAQSRRIRKQVWQEVTVNTVKTYALKSDRRFLYDGWNLVAEIDPDGTPARTYLWGTDISGSGQGAGGVGGLLAINIFKGPAAAIGVHFPSYDANGNIIALTSASTGTESAHYSYDAFGQELRASGPASQANPFHFSTKFTDEETGLVYYGYRYLDPASSKWISRDPIRESGGVNVYGFANNNPLSTFDPRGQYPSSDRIVGPDGVLNSIDSRWKGVALDVAWDSYWGKGPVPESATQYVSDEVKALSILSLAFEPGGDDDGGNQFVYTCKRGWIDVGHFFQTATAAALLKNYFDAKRVPSSANLAAELAYSAGYALEVHQLIAKISGGSGPLWKVLKALEGQLPKPFQKGPQDYVTGTDGWSSSAFTLEDLPSDWFGAQFGAGIGRTDRTLGVYSAVSDIRAKFQEFLKNAGAVDPSNRVGGGFKAGDYLRADTIYFEQQAKRRTIDAASGAFAFDRNPVKTISHCKVCDSSDNPIKK